MADVGVESSWIRHGLVRQVAPKEFGLLTTFSGAAVAAKAVLAGDGIALLHDGIFGGCALRLDGCIDGLLTAQIEAHDSPGNLRFVIV